MIHHLSFLQLYYEDQAKEEQGILELCLFYFFCFAFSPLILPLSSLVLNQEQKGCHLAFRQQSHQHVSDVFHLQETLQDPQHLRLSRLSFYFFRVSYFSTALGL